MRQMVVNICHIVINNPNNKEDLLEKMKEIEDIEDHEINIQVELMEETTKKESKEKLGYLTIVIFIEKEDIERHVKMNELMQVKLFMRRLKVNVNVYETEIIFR